MLRHIDVEDLVQSDLDDGLGLLILVRHEINALELDVELHDVLFGVLLPECVDRQPQDLAIAIVLIIAHLREPGGFDFLVEEVALDFVEDSCLFLIDQRVVRFSHGVLFN